MNNYIQKIVEDFNFNSIHGDNNKANSFAENVLGIVDLGLPSGLLWCECNLGAENDYEYGDYYAWGELTTKNEYWNTNYTYKDNPKQLPLEYDVATHILGNNYSIPTKKQFNELLKYTTNDWVTNYKGTGVNGRLFIGRNRNTLFFPAAGYRSGSSLDAAGNYGSVQSSNLYANGLGCAWSMNFDKAKAYVDNTSRCYGRSIRPVFKKINL